MTLAADLWPSDKAPGLPFLCKYFTMLSHLREMQGFKPGATILVHTPHRREMTWGLREISPQDVGNNRSMLLRIVRFYQNEIICYPYTPQISLVKSIAIGTVSETQTIS